MGVSQGWTDTFEGVKPSVEPLPPHRVGRRVGPLRASIVLTSENTTKTKPLHLLPGRKRRGAAQHKYPRPARRGEVKW